MRIKIGFLIFSLFTLVFGFLFTKSALAANYTLSGSVKDNSANAIVGATVSVNDPNSDSTTTDSSGNYSMSIPQGTYNIKVTPPSGNTFGPTVAPNYAITTNTVINFVLVPAGTVRLSGHLYGSTGLPISNQTVDIHTSSNNNEVTSVTTDASGAYSVSLSPNTYDIRLIGNSNSIAGSPNSYYVVIGSYSLTQSTVLDLTLPGKKVTVHIQDSSGNPVNNVGVSAGNSALSVNIAGGSYFASDSSSGNTNTSGDATLYLFPATYTFTATPPSGSNFLTTNLSNISITGDQTVTITMQQPITLSGHLYGSTGLPLPNQTVDIHDSSTNHEITSVTTNSSGTYSIALSPNTYDIRLIGNNINSSLGVPNNSYYIVIGSYSLIHNTVLDITIPAKKVTVHVQDILGNPVTNVGVSTGNSSLSVPLLGSSYFASDFASGTTDTSGNAILYVLPVANYTFTATPPSGGNFLTTTSTISVSNDTTLTITMQQQSVTLSGHLYGSTGLPLPNQTIDIHDSATNHEVTSVTTDASGAYSISLAPNTYDIRLIGNNNSLSLGIPNNSYYIVIGSYSLIRNTVLDITIPAKQVTVHVQDILGNPVTNVGVSTGNSALNVNIAGGSYFASDSSSGNTNASGDAILYLFPATYTFTATPPSGSIYSQFALSNINVTSDQTELISLQYNHPAPITTINLATRYSNETYTDPTTVTLSATAASGFSIANTYYKVDGGTQQTYTASFTISGSGSHTISYWSVDTVGVPETPHTKTFSVDDPPKINSVPGATINEGSTYTATGSFTDPDSTSWIGTVDYGDGSGVQPLTINPDKTFTLSHQYLDNKPNNAPYTVTVTITDNQGAGSTVTTSVVVTNVPPTVPPIAVLTNPVALGNSASVDSVSFTDPGVLDTHTAVWNWGDGTTSQGTVIETNGSGYVSATDHVYATTGLYTITLTVTDNDGASGNSSSQYVAVYQPSRSGLFSGHSTYASPVGAYMQNPTLTGTVHFAISVKYANGSNVPTGNVQMKFPTTNLTFTSSSFDWLVINGSQATLVGRGTLNGMSGYTFLTSGIDGTQTGTGYIRFQIKDASGHIVYDTQPGAVDTVTPTIPVTGMVVVHN